MTFISVGKCQSIFEMRISKTTLFLCIAIQMITSNPIAQYYSDQAICTAPGSGLLCCTYPNRIGFSGALGNLSKIGLSPGKNRRPAR